MRYIVPIILLILSVTSFMMFTNPAYQGNGQACPSNDPSAPYANCGTKQLKDLSTQYNKALDNSLKLRSQREALATKYHNESPDSLGRLQKMLPDNADNIRLIIDLQSMAQSYGLSLSSIKFDATQTASAIGGNPLVAGTPADVAQASQDYGTFNIEFSTTATYQNFLSFLHDIESSLRLTDVVSIDFSSADTNKATSVYTIKLKTYWLRG